MNKTSTRLLVVEDNPSDVRRINELLRDVESAERFILTVVGRLDEALHLLDTQSFDVILLDLTPPDAHELTTIKTLAARTPSTPIIVIAELADAAMPVNVIRAGAQDCLAKNSLNSEMIVHSIQSAIERARIRNKLLEQEAQYRLLAENITDLIVRHSPDSTIRYVSPSCRVLLGYEPDEMIGHKSDEFFHPDDLPILNNVREQSRRALNNYTITYRFRHKDGTYRWFETTGKVTRDSETYRVVETISVSRDITERYNAEETTRLLQKAVEQTDDAIIIMSAESDLSDSRIVFVNPAFAHLTGYLPENLIGRKRSILQDHLTDPELSKQVSETLARGESIRGESVNHRQDGTEYEVAWNIAPIRDASGTITHYVCTQRDVTEHRHEERALLESEARFKAISESLPVAVAITRLSGSGTILYANNLYCDVMGVLHGAAVGMQARDFYSNPGDRDKFVHEVSQNRSVSGRELQITRADGSLRWILVSASTIMFDGATALLNGLQDITETKQLEKERALLAAIVESSEDAVIGKSLDGVILSWNRGAQHMYGYTPDEAIGQSIQILSSPERPDEIPTLLKRIRDGGYVTQHETVRMTKAGKRLDISLAVAPVYTANGVIVGAASIARDITERKQAEEALKQSEQRFRSLFENSPISLWEQDYSATKRMLDQLRAQGVTDFETYFKQNPQALQECIASVHTVNVNQATLGLYHAPDKQALLNMALRLPIDTMVARTTNFLAAVAAGETSYHTEFVNETYDGSLIILDVTWTVVPGFEDTFAHVIRSVVDISERKQTEHALRQFNQRIGGLRNIDRGILTAQPIQEIAGMIAQTLTDMMKCDVVRIIAIDMHDNSLAYLANLPPASQLSQELLRQAIENFGFPDSFRQGEALWINDIKTSSDLWVGFEEVLTAKGARAWIIAPLIVGEQLFGLLAAGSSRPFAFTPEHFEIAREIADQLAVALHKNHLDEQIQEHARMLEAHVTERTEQLRSAKERIETILMSASDAMIVANLDGSIEQVNTAFTALFGYTLEQGRAISLFSLVDSASAGTVRRTLNEIVEGGQAKRLELVGMRQGGALFDADAAFSRVEDGKPNTLICSIRDITLRKQAEENLHQALAKERELGELKMRFVSMVSHEFRTPLSSILTSSDLMKLYSDRMSSEKKLEHLERIQTQVKHLTDLLEDVLFMSRTESVGVQLNLTPTNFEAFCRRLVDEFQLTDPTHKLQFISTVPELIIQVDSKLMRQVVMNLLANAIKYSSEGTVVYINLIREASSIVLRVSDQGIGIPEEDKKHLFELFHRAQNVGTTPGTGLGLTIVKRAVEAHHGTVSVESQVGSGTTFTIAIPIT